MKKKQNKCATCKNLDTEKSNANWLVCKLQPLELEVVLKGSEFCKKFEAMVKS